MYLFRCPACDKVHYFTVPPWHFVGEDGKPTTVADFEKPTVRHSIAVQAEPYCHSFITAGRIAYEKDCGHSLAGQTVDLPPFAW